MVFAPELKRFFLGSRSRTSTTLIVHRSTVCPASPPHPTLMAPSAASAGDPTKVPLGSSPLMVMKQEELVLGELVQETSEEGSAKEAPA
jgi:hypothetical protein